MTGRRVAQISSATASLAVAALMTSAAPANAATYSTNLAVNGSCVATTSSGNAIPLTLQPNDQVTIVLGSQALCSVYVSGPGNLTGWTINSVSQNGVSSYFTSLTMGPTLTITVGSAPADIYTTSGASRVTTIATAAGSGGGGTPSGGSSSTQASMTPAPVIQQFGRPRSGTCGDAAPAALNWGGASSGGWGESWAQWANGGAGGAVCTRTLQYSNATGIWSVG